MNDIFYRGYVKTKNKHCIEKYKNRTKFSSYEEIKAYPEYAGILAPDTILIDVDDAEESEIMMNIVEALQLNCRVIKTTRGKHFLFYNKDRKVEKCSTHSTLACGLSADIKVGCSNSYEVLKFAGEESFVEWDVDPGSTFFHAANQGNSPLCGNGSRRRAKSSPIQLYSSTSNKRIPERRNQGYHSIDQSICFAGAFGRFRSRGDSKG